MIQAIKNNFLLIVVGAVLAVAAIMLPTTVSAQQEDIQGNLDCGSNINLDPGGQCSVSASGNSIENVIKTIINVFSAIVGAVAVIMIIVGGFRYITSGGDSNNVGAAKNTILYAIVGLILVALAQIIVQFILGRVV